MAGTSSATAAVKLIKKHLRGAFAVYKSKGLSCADTAAQVQLQLHDDLDCRLALHGLVVCYTGVLDKESHGIMGCYIGKRTARMKAASYGFAKYEIAAKLGTETDNLHASGVIVNEKPYNHVTEENLSAAIKKFKGTITQLQPEEYFNCTALHSGIFRGPDVAEERILNRSVHCTELLCSSFHPPDLSFKVTCSASLDVASLIKDLGRELGTCAHILDSKRIALGPFTLHDALPKYQWSWRYIQEAIKISKENMKLKSFAN